MFVALIVSFSLITAFAHGGRTDDNGGHYDQDTGEYHYHHGYSAHQHSNGECPYDYKNNVTERENTTKQRSPRNSSRKDDISLSLFVKISPFYNWSIIDAIHLLCTFVVVLLLLWLFSKDFKRKEIESITVFIIDLLLLVAFSLSLDFAGASSETFINTCVCGFIGLTLGNIFALILLFKISPYLIEFVEFVFNCVCNLSKKHKETKQQTTNEFEILTDDSTIVCYKREIDNQETTVVPKYSENSLYQLYVVGKDIPQGKTEFSARSKRGGHITVYQSKDGDFLREYIDFPKSFSVELKEGENVEVFNCRWKSTQNDRSDNQ